MPNTNADVKKLKKAVAKMAKEHKKLMSDISSLKKCAKKMEGQIKSKGREDERLAMQIYHLKKKVTNPVKKTATKKKTTKKKTTKKKR